MNAVARSFCTNTVDCLNFNYKKDDSTLVKVAKVAASITLYAAFGAGISFVAMSLASAQAAFIPLGLAYGAGVGASCSIIMSIFRFMIMRMDHFKHLKGDEPQQPPVEEPQPPVEEPQPPVEEPQQPPVEEPQPPVNQQPPVAEKPFIEKYPILTSTGLSVVGALGRAAFNSLFR